MKNLAAPSNRTENVLRSPIVIPAVMPEPGGPGGSLAPPIFVRSVNPIPTREGSSSPHITNGTPNVFYLPASLECILHISYCRKCCIDYSDGHDCFWTICWWSNEFFIIWYQACFDFWSYPSCVVLHDDMCVLKPWINNRVRNFPSLWLSSFVKWL